MEDDYDIYGDLEEDIIFNSEDTAIVMPPVLPSSSTNEDKQIIEDLKKSLAEVKARNRQLNINCSFLLATSKAELDRKNALIQSTRKELDSYLFRKRKVCQADTAEKGTQADLIRNSEEANSRKRTSQRDDSRRNRSPSRDRQRYTKEAHRSSDNKRRSRSPRYDRNRNKGNQDHERRRSRGRDERTSSRSVKVPDKRENSEERLKKKEKLEIGEAKSVKNLKLDDNKNRSSRSSSSSKSLKSSKEQDQAKSTKEIKEEIKDEPIDSPVDFKFISKKNSLDCKIENLPTNDVKLTETAPSFSEKYSQDSLIVDELLPEQILSTVKSELVVKSESTIATKETHKKSDKVTKKSSDKEVKPLVDDAMKKVENIEVKKESTEIKIEVPGKIEVKTTKVVKIEKKTELAPELSKKSFKIPKKSSSANKKVVPSVDFRQVLENEEISTIIKPLAKRDRFKSRKDSESKAEIVKVAKTNDPPATMPKTKREPKKKPQVIKRPLYTDQEDLPPAKKLRQMESDVEFLKSFKVKVGDKKIPETKVQKVEMPQMEEKLSKSEIREIREITKIAEFKEPEVAQVLTDANNTDEILLSPIMTESFVNNNGMSDSFMENLNLSMTPKSFNINIAAQSSAKIKDSTINDSIEEEMKRIEAGHVNAVKISEDQPSSKEKCVKQEVEVGISEINNNSITAIPLFQKVELPDSTASPQSDRSKENVLQNANTSGDAPWIWNTKKSEYRREVEDGQTIFYVTRKKKNNKKKTG